MNTKRQLTELRQAFEMANMVPFGIADRLLTIMESLCEEIEQLKDAIDRLQSRPSKPINPIYRD